MTAYLAVGCALWVLLVCTELVCIQAYELDLPGWQSKVGGWIVKRGK